MRRAVVAHLARVVVVTRAIGRCAFSFVVEEVLVDVLEDEGVLGNHRSCARS